MKNMNTDGVPWRRPVGAGSCLCKCPTHQPGGMSITRTVVNWHREGFRLYWSWISRVRQVEGRKRVSKEIRTLIFPMVAENPTWGAPRIHGELLKLGFEVSEKSVSRWIRPSSARSRSCETMADVSQKPSRGHCCDGLLHRPTLTFGVLYCFFVISHNRRKILHFNVTQNPNALSYSNCAKLGLTCRRTDSCYSTATRSLVPMRFRLCGR